MSPKTADNKNLRGIDFAKGINLADLKDNVAVQGFVNEHDVVMAKVGPSIFCVAAKCSHFGAPLAKGIITAKGIHCPWHHACFRLEDGSVERAPALDALPSFSTHVNNGMVTVRARKNIATKTLRPKKMPPSVTLLGLGAAGMGAASELRAAGFAGPIVAYDAEQEAPYDRIKLSKGLLRGAINQRDVAMTSDVLQAQGIVHHRGANVASIVRDQKMLRLKDGSLHPYDILLLATGATPRRLPIEGALLPHVHVLRSLGDAMRLRQAKPSLKKVVIVGASFIGLEAAASLACEDLQVHVLHNQSDAPLTAVLGAALAERIAVAHAQHGVTIHRNRAIKSIQQNTVTLDDDSVWPADAVLMAVGVEPNVALAQSAGLEVQNGVVVDRHFRTQDLSIYAAGDVAAYPFAAGAAPQRIEHWAVAMQMGRAAAGCMLGKDEPLSAAPFFWTEQHGIKVRYVGHAPKNCRAEVWGQAKNGPMATAFFTEMQISAVATVDCDSVSLEVEAALDAGLPHKVPALLSRALGNPASTVAS